MNVNNVWIYAIYVYVYICIECCLLNMIKSADIYVYIHTYGSMFFCPPNSSRLQVWCKKKTSVLKLSAIPRFHLNARVKPTETVLLVATVHNVNVDVGEWESIVTSRDFRQNRKKRRKHGRRGKAVAVGFHRSPVSIFPIRASNAADCCPNQKIHSSPPPLITHGPPVFF